MLYNSQQLSNRNEWLNMKGLALNYNQWNNNKIDNRIRCE